MNTRKFFIYLLLAVTALSWGVEQGWARPLTVPGGQPDYFETPNWANSPPLRKFVDTLAPLGCGATNNLGQCISVAVPNTTSYPGSHYYEIELVEYREQMHSDLPAVVGAKTSPAATGGTKLRGYRQINHPGGPQTPQYLGPLIIATKYDPAYVPGAALPGGGTNGFPVRIKFTNSLPTGTGGNLFIPVDTTIMGSGMGPKTDAGAPCDPKTQACAEFTQNRATLHLHGGRTPWISDGTPHQWITPAGETTPYPKGVSVQNVPDMPDPGSGSQTFYYTNQQSARLMFYHDHAWGITRLNVYVGEAAGYLIQDPVEQALIKPGFIPADQIPLIIQDKTFVDSNPANPTYIWNTDPTWNWGTGARSPGTGNITEVKTGDLWWPHVYMPAENPYNPDMSGANPFGRWFYGPWFFPATPVCGSSPNAVKPLCIEFGAVPNPFADPANPQYSPNQPPEIPGTPNVSWGAEAFMDTMMVNGTVYPTVTLSPKEYRFRILNAAHDRFLNLQLYLADTTVPAGCAGCAANTEVKMTSASPDGREGGVPDPATKGPAMIQIGNEGGFLPAPVVLPNEPITWNFDPTTFNFGNVDAGTLILGPAERADVIVDFTKFAGKTLILYNDAPTAFPALVPQYNYYTGAPDRTDMGGIAGTPVGLGPNIRTVMQIVVTGSGGVATPDDYNTTTLANMQAAFASTPTTPGAFAQGQEPIIVGQAAYGTNAAVGNTAYSKTFSETWPYWGISRISDTSISFQKVDGTKVSNFPMKPKAIHDEMGASFDDYGRMAAKLGLEVANTNAAIANFVLQNYVDPATENVKSGEAQIWKITHNGVDTHPIHFHLFDVQVINRVGWDGLIRLPDPNELGWKETLRVSPLEDTIVAFRAIAPIVPFPLPNSTRALNPASPIGSEEGFSQVDTLTGGPLTPHTTNVMADFGHEYVWHCHILSHEENDMMRPLVMRVPTAAPNAPTYLGATVVGNTVQLTWTPGADVSPNDPIGYRIVRNGANITTVYPHMTTYTADTLISSGATYNYTVIAYNAFGDSPASPTASVTMGTWGPATRVTITPSQPFAIVGTAVTIAASGAGSTVPYQYQFLLNGVVVQDYSTVSTWRLPPSMPLGNYVITVNVRTSTISTTPDATATLYYPVVSSGELLYAVNSGTGISKWDGTAWSQLNSTVPTSMVASGLILYADFAGDGFYKYDGSAWTLLTRSHPASMVASGSILYADFAGDGFYKYDGSAWTQLTNAHPVSMVASGTVLYADFAAYGLYKWDGSAWTQLTNAHPASMVASGAVLYADFAAYGLYKWDGSAWTLLTGSHPQNMVASSAVLYADFTSDGLSKYDGSAWTLLTGSHPQSMVASGSILYADFMGYGLYKRVANAWSQLSPLDPSIMVAGF